MGKHDSKSGKSTTESPPPTTTSPKTPPKQTSSKPKGRSFVCSVFIYTFVFVSGVIVATILPDLAGHHFKQPYGKEYGAIAEQIVKDLPKHLTRLRETIVLLAHNLVDRVWDLKAQVEKLVLNTNNKKEEKAKTKTTTQRPSTRTHGTKINNTFE